MKEETYKKIILYLAHHKEAKQYDIANDPEVNLTYAPVHQAIEHLLLKNLVEETKKENGQGPLPKRYFRLTFPGFITALALFSFQDTVTKGVDPQVKNALRKTILEQRIFHPEIKIFSEWEFLENIFKKFEEPAFKDDIYNFLMIAAMSWFKEFSPLDKINKAYLKTEFTEDYKKEHVAMTPLMRRRFISLFFQTLTFYMKEEGVLENAMGRTPNKVLSDFVAAFFEKEKQRKMAKIRKMEKARDLLLKHFASS